MNIYELLYNPLELNPPIIMGSLFSGIGTPEMALKRITSNYELAFISEIDHHAIRTYHAIHGDVQNLNSVEHIVSIPYVDILHHSPPCQDISSAGLRQGLQEGTRSNLIYQTIRILKNTEQKPRVVIMEQVPNLLQSTFQQNYREVYYELEQMGYQTYTEILSPWDFGIPQIRERVFMVSLLGEYSFQFPKPDPMVPRKILGDFLENNVNPKYYLTKKGWAGMQAHKERHNADGHGFGYSLFTRKSDRINSVLQRYYKDGKEILVTENNGRIRRLTPRECWRLMDIDDKLFDKAHTVNNDIQLYRQAGNALVVKVYEKILRKLIHKEAVTHGKT